MSSGETYGRHPYIELDNAVSLNIYRRLRRAIKECEPQAAPHLNLATVFFHDLMRILTGYALRVDELNGPFRPRTRDEFTPVPRIPYVGFSDIENGLDPNSKTYGLVAPRVGRRRRWASAVSRVTGPVLGSWGTVAIARPSALNTRRLVSSLLRAKMQVTFPSPAPLAVPGLTAQLTRLQRCIQEISEQNAWSGAARSLSEVVERHILALAAEGEPERVSHQVLICGSLANNFNRLLAARSRAAGVPVVAVGHGVTEGTHDEPVFGYGERTFATVMLGFGPGGAELPNIAEYAQSLYDPPEYVESDSPEVREVYSGPEVVPLGSMEGKRVLYVPTSFSGSARYGPFRDMPDRMYLQWQEALLREFPDTVWKGHPKEKTVHEFVPSRARSVSRIPFQECLDHADVFIFDYLSTAFCQAAATLKPIIFFDIGLRNHSEAAQRAISERCIYVRADPENPGRLKDRVLSLLQEPRVNAFSQQFSLATTPSLKGRIGVALEILEGLLR